MCIASATPAAPRMSATRSHSSTARRFRPCRQSNISLAAKFRGLNWKTFLIFTPSCSNRNQPADRRSVPLAAAALIAATRSGAGGVDAEAPNPKFQAPGNLQDPKLKKTVRALFGCWTLELAWDLELGIWVLSLAPLIDPIVHGLVPKARVLRLQYPMAFVREVQHLRRHLQPL